MMSSPFRNCAWRLQSNIVFAAWLTGGGMLAFFPVIETLVRVALLFWYINDMLSLFNTNNGLVMLATFS